MKRFGLKIVLSLAFGFLLSSCATIEQNMFNKYYKKICSVPEGAKLKKDADPVIIEREYNEFLEDLLEIESNYFVLCGKMEGVNSSLAYGHNMGRFKKIIKTFAKSASIPFVVFSKASTSTEMYRNSNGTYTEGLTLNFYDIYYFYPMTAQERENVSIGLKVEKPNKKQLESLGANNGLKVSIVYLNSPAFDANIVVDDVILSVNAKDMNSVDDWKNFQQSANEGDELDFLLIRKGRERNIKFKLNNNTQENNTDE